MLRTIGAKYATPQKNVIGNEQFTFKVLNKFDKHRMKY